MFGTSPTKNENLEQSPESLQEPDTAASANLSNNSKSDISSEGGLKSPGSPMGRKSGDEGGQNTEKSGDKRSRRISGVERAKGMFTSAKNSFISSSPTRSPSNKEPQTPMQKLGETDPVLGVPQGSLNNAAGESAPGPRSTFRVGVTEDKNKKCRRTMEDTHAYLYNFLSTPAPALDDGELQPTTSSSDAASIKSNISGKPIVETDNGYFAVFDGHAGSFAAEWCGKKLHILLEENIKKNPNTPIPELLDMTFTSVDQQLEKLPLKNSGCTAVVAVLRWEDRVPTSTSATGSSAIAPAVMKASAALSPETSNDSNTRKSSAVPSEPGKSRQGSMAVERELRASAMRQRVLYTANVGDARIVLCRNGKALRLSYDHKGSDEHEGKRIANAGGLVLNNRVNGVLAVTRALGDAYMKDLVTGHPYTTETVIQPDIDEFLILACDGLWDVCTDQDAVDFVRSTQDPLIASKQLVDHALARFSTDNLSCMVVRFNNKAVQDTVEHRTDPIGVEGDPTVKDGVSETTAIVHASARRLSEASSGPSSRNHSISHTSPPLRSHSQSQAPSSGTELERIVSADEGFIPGMPANQEPGPELNVDVLKEAQEKAVEGKAAVEQGAVRH